MTTVHLRTHDPVDSDEPELSLAPSSPLEAIDTPISAGPRPTPLPVPLRGSISGERSSATRSIQIKDRKSGRVLAQALATPAQSSTLLRDVTDDHEALGTCTMVSDLGFDSDHHEQLVAPLLYLALRRSRIEERPVLLTATREPNDPAAALLDLTPLPRLGRLTVDGSSWSPMAQRVDLSIHRAFTRASQPMQELLRDQFVPEAVELLDHWTERFFQTPFFRAVRDGTLTKEQYVYSLSNMYQFVRWTTRLIGLAISHSADKVIRHKWIEHLREEVDHEVIIERDLAALGVDVDYVKHVMLPNVTTQQFMVAQESSIAFHRDPVCFMASPFAAEGFAARLDRSFAEALRRTAASWGVDNPKRCTVFWCSHLEFDGGDDGHYEHSRAVLRHCLRTDTDLLRFLNAARLAMQAMEVGYTAYVEDLAIFGASHSSQIPT